MNTKNITKLNDVLKIAIITTGAVFTLLYFIPGTSAYKIWSYLATICLVFVPNILRILQIKIDDKIELAYLLFLIPAMVLGIDFDLYKAVPALDKVVHAASGVLSAFVARSFLRQTTSTEKPWFKALFVMGLVALIAVLWECFEFSYDQLFNGQMQQLIIPGLSDTMWDMIMALIGGGVTTMFTMFRKDQIKQS